MQLLKDRILKEGRVERQGVLKVDSFLNHQIDVDLFNEMGKYFKEIFKDCGVTKILTIEASGIGIACIAAQYFNVPVLFAKKYENIGIDEDSFKSTVHSFTKGRDYYIKVSKRYLGAGDRVLVVDDFLANGHAVIGLKDIVEQAGASLVGVGIAIEKGFQDGGRLLREKGINVHSLAIIKSMENGKIEFGQA